MSDNSALTLLVLAGGLGSRFGGLKQMAPFGPNGETILDYSVFDAARAGFTRVVFVIREDFADAFRRRIDARYGGRLDVAYVCQDIHDVPPKFSVPPDRTKPWGTLHAVLAARKLIDRPFAVVNADDFYGPGAYREIARFLVSLAPGEDGLEHCCLVGYRLAKTLSPGGGVNRAICHVTPQGMLAGVEEHTAIARDADGVVRALNLAGDPVVVPDDVLVSMNLWGFKPSAFPKMAQCFADFLAIRGGDPRAECYIPSAIDGLIRTNQADCSVLTTEETWFGVTYPQDREHCVQRLAAMTTEGRYPESLWS